MKLHANAALSLNRRRLLCRRVCEQGWSLAELRNNPLGFYS